MRNKPFQNMFPAEDICKCNNTKCREKGSCFRFMGASTEYQSMSTFGTEKGEKCTNFYPYYVWRSAEGKNLMLKDIDNDYLKNIIIHLFERADNEQFEGDFAKNSILIAREFIKEAKRRKIYR